jgi:ankyrin repeat protein
MGKIEVVKLLLADARADINIPDKNGRTPLMNAVNKKNTKIVRLLIDKGTYF